MAMRLIACFLLLSSAISSQCHPFPADRPVMYKYNVIARSMIDPPGSDMNIDAIYAYVTLRAHGNFVKVQLSGGDPKETEFLINFNEIYRKALRPFVIEYDVAGKAIGVYTDKDDHRMSINFKKALASLLQLDAEQIGAPRTTSVDEQSVYGNCPVIYHVQKSNSTNGTVVDKTLDPTKCTGYVASTANNFNFGPERCDRALSHPIETLVKRAYHVEDNGVISSVSSENIVSVTPAFGQPQMIVIIQTIDEYTPYPTAEPNSPVDVSNMVSHKLRVDVDSWSDLYGFKVEKSARLGIEEIHQKIRGGLRYVMARLAPDASTFNPSTYSSGDETLYPLIELVRSLNATEMTNAYAVFRGESENLGGLFLQIASLSGTDDWIRFMRNEIDSGTLSNYEAKFLFEQFPFNVKRPDENIINDMLNLAGGENVKTELRDTIILSTASVLSKYLQVRPKNQAALIFVRRFIDDFKAAKTADRQLVYISALFNIRSPSVTKFMETIITSNTGLYSSQIRGMAIFSLKSNNDEQYVNRILWPILNDDSNTLELRYAAMNVLVSTRSMENLLKLHLLMSSEEDDQLYNAFYKFLESVASSNVPCYSSFSERARSIMKMFRGFRQRQSSAFLQLDGYFADKFNFGGTIKTSMIGNLFKDQFTVFFAETSSQVAGLSLKHDSICAYVKLKNLTAAQEIFENRNHHKRYFTQFSYALGLNLTEIDLIRFYNDKIVSVDCDVGNQFDNGESYLSHFSGNNTNDNFNAVQSISGEVFIPNEFGLPLAFFLHTPVVQKFNFNLNVTADNVEFVSNLNQFYHSTYGLKWYNTVFNSWIGIRWNRIAQLNIPSNVSLKVVPQSDVVRLLLDHKDNNKSNAYEFKSFGFQDNFVEPLDKAIQSVVPSLKRSTVETFNKNLSENVLWELDCPHTDTTFRIVSHGCKDGKTLLKGVTNAIFDNSNKYSGDGMLANFILSMGNAWGYATVMPEETSPACGLEVRIEPNHKVAITELKLKKQGCPNIGNRMCTKLNFDIRQSFEGGLNGPNSWDFDIDMQDMYMESTTASVKISHSSGGNNWTACFESQAYYSGDESNSTYVFNSGPSNDGECPGDKGEASIEIVGKGEPSLEQTDSRVLEEAYNDCMIDTHTLRCLNKFVLARKHTFDITYRNVSDSWWRMATIFKNTLAGYTESYSFPEHDVKKNTFRVEVEYPISSDNLFDVNVTTAFVDLELKSVPTGKLYPINMLVPKSVYHAMTVSVGRLDHIIEKCQATSSYLINVDSKKRELELDENWLTLVDVGGFHTKRRRFSIKKYGQDEMILRFQDILTEAPETDDTQLIETIENELVIYRGEGNQFNITLNNGTFAYEKFKYVHGDFIDYIITDDRMIFNTQNEELWVNYNGKTIDMSFLNVKNYYGECKNPHNVFADTF